MEKVQEFRILLKFVEDYQPSGIFAVTILRVDGPNDRIVTYLNNKDFYGQYLQYGDIQQMKSNPGLIKQQSAKKVHSS